MPPAISPGMPVADQVRLAALLLEQHYGVGASEVAVRGIYQSLDRGDLPRADAWRELLIAIEAAMPTSRVSPGRPH